MHLGKGPYFTTVTCDCNNYYTDKPGAYSALILHPPPPPTFLSISSLFHRCLKLIKPFTRAARNHPCGYMSCDVISFNGQGQLCLLTCAEGRGLSNRTRMSSIYSRTLDKKAKQLVTLT